MYSVFKFFGSFCFVSLVSAFSPHPTHTSNPSISRTLSIMAANKPSGSFFNQVPDKDEDSNEGYGINRDSDVPVDPFEESLTRMMKSRSEKKAKQPSTIGGVPVSGVGTSFIYYIIWVF